MKQREKKIKKNNREERDVPDISSFDTFLGLIYEVLFVDTMHHNSIQYVHSDDFCSHHASSFHYYRCLTMTFFVYFPLVLYPAFDQLLLTAWVAATKWLSSIGSNFHVESLSYYHHYHYSHDAHHPLKFVPHSNLLIYHERTYDEML